MGGANHAHVGLPFRRVKRGNLAREFGQTVVQSIRFRIDDQKAGPSDAMVLDEDFPANRRVLCGGRSAIGRDEMRVLRGRETRRTAE